MNMMRWPQVREVGILIALGIGIPVILFCGSLVKEGDRSFGVIETIHGIPYPVQDGSTRILEDMAHVDLFLQEPVLGKKVLVTITFDPENSDSIDIGVRDNEFWLSYIKYPLYKKGQDPKTIQTKTIEIPLSLALADTNRSVDMMIFTQSSSALPQWRIRDIHASVEFDMPSVFETKSYVKSVLMKERPI
jgi:hypothetical protein